MAYLVKGVNRSRCGYAGFLYPDVGGYIEATDWDEAETCYGGIFGIDEDYFLYNIENAIYLIIEYDGKRVPIGNGKIKIKGGVVVFISENIFDIQAWLFEKGIPYNGYHATQTAGDRAIQTAAYQATQTAGYRSTQTAGDCSTQTAAYRSTQTAGHRSTQTAGDRATQTAGYQATQTAGNWATQTADDEATCVIHGSESVLCPVGILIFIMHHKSKIYIKKTTQKMIGNKYSMKIINNKLTCTKIE